MKAFSFCISFISCTIFVFSFSNFGDGKESSILLYDLALLSRFLVALTSIVDAIKLIFY